MSTCASYGKVSYARAADAHIARKLILNRSYRGGDLSVYRCEACGEYHLGNDESKRAKRREKVRR